MLVDIDVKHLRWVSWILADGSQIRSLSGRSAQLGDGYSRNPPDRDQLIEQRSKDLEGRTGQLRGAFVGRVPRGLRSGRGAVLLERW